MSPATVAIRCGYCNGPMPTPTGRGRPRRYCRDECREAAKHQRRAARQVGWQHLGELAEIPDDPLTRRRVTMTALAELLEGEAPAAPEDQLATALIEANQLAFTLRRVADDVAPALRPRALGLATAIRTGMTRYFGELA